MASGPVPLREACVGDRFVVLSETGFEPELGNEVRTDFAAELAHRGVALCEEGTPRAPDAVVQLAATDSTVEIQLDDRLTHKRVARDLSLASIPPNGRALAIAIAIDELLRASWAELTLRRGREEAEDEEEYEDDYDDFYRVHDSKPLSTRTKPRERMRYRLAVDATYLHGTRDFDAFAGGVRGALRPWGWGWFELGLGGFGAIPVHASDGDVRASGFRSTLTAGVCSRGHRAVFGCGGVRAELDALHLGSAHPKMARSRSGNAAILQASVVGLLGVWLRRDTFLFGELGVGAVLHGAKATDSDGRTLMGVTGLMLSLSVGLGYER